MQARQTRSTITPGLTFLFAVASGAAVGNLYWAQPLLQLIAGDLGVATATAGLLVTATQVGYASGVLLIVPLGDLLDRRRLVPALMLTAAVALLACAAAPSFAALAVALFALGLTTISGQVLIPLAADLAAPSARGRVVGSVASGILTGILLSRTISGFVAGAAGWRAVYAMAAVAAVILALLLHRALPTLAPRTRLPYRALLRSVFAVVAREPTVRWTLALGATGFASFTMFWTALTFLLSSPPFGYSVTVIGLFGLVGLAGAVSAQRAGWLHDRGWDLPATGAAWALALVSWIVARAAAGSVVGVIVAIVLLDVAAQGQTLLNQTRLFTVAPDARSRLNTAFVVCNFLGGAAGSALATTLWASGAWHAVTLAGAGLALFGLTVWGLGRRGPLRAKGTEPAPTGTAAD